MRAVIKWSVSRPVVANLLMVFLLVVGGVCAWKMRRELFPEFSLDRIEVSVVYKGASVEEIEESICSKIEEEITGIEGIDKITSTAVEGKGVVIAELEPNTNVSRVLNEVKNAVDQIDSFPEESDRPVTVELTSNWPVIKVAVYGDLSEKTLVALAEQVKNEIMALPGVTQVELVGEREHEIAIEIPEVTLRKYGLTLSKVAAVIRKNSLDLPAGTLRAESGQILIRTKGRRYRARDFEDLIVVWKPDGTAIPLHRIATIRDTFEEIDVQGRMDGKPAVLIAVQKTSNQDAVKIAKRVREYVEKKRETLPPMVQIAAWDNISVLIQSRLDLMKRNGLQGLVLVMIILTLFLRLRLAFWIAMGVPISIVGSFVLLSFFGHTLNMISLYSFIVVLGIVVDDAIVVGENVYSKMQEGMDPITATIEGAREIAFPVINSVATTIVAFAPMLFVAGTIGKFMRVFPAAIIAVLLLSLAEAFLILPAHLAHMKREENAKWKWNPLLLAERVRMRVQVWLDRFVETRFLPFMKLVMERRYYFVAGILSLLILSAGLVAGGRIAFTFFPKVDSDKISAKLIMPQGTSLKTTQAAVRRMESAAQEMAAQFPLKDGKSVIKHMFSMIGEPIRRTDSRDKGSHTAEILIELVESEERGIPSSKLASAWRKLIGEIPDALSLTFRSSGGHRPGGKPLQIVLLGDDMRELLVAADRFKKKLATFQGVYDIEDSYRPGKKEFRISLKEGARQLGLTLEDVARQIRANFWGEEALKVQRGRNEVTVRVRYPEREREAPGDLEKAKIRTPDNKEVPFGQVAKIEEYQGPASIHRKYRKKTVTVSADVDEERANAREIVNKLSQGFIPELERDFPGLGVMFEGQEEERAKSMDSLFQGLWVALFLIFVLLVNMFRTYTEPVIVMTAIPFSFIGIIAGHLLFRMDFSILSMFGVLALAGVVVNDSLLLLEAADREAEKGVELQEALLLGARKRFRQIILTTLSTTAGLTPILLERSYQAQFLKPMTITVVFGLAASTVLILLLIPALSMIRADILGLMGRDPRPTNHLEA